MTSNRAKELVEWGWTLAQVPMSAVLDERVSDAELRVLTYLLWRQEGEWMSIVDIADEMGKPILSIESCLDALKERGYVSRSLGTVIAYPKAERLGER